MKNNFIEVIEIFFIFFICGCNNNIKPDVSNTDSVKFFPMEDYFLQQVKTVDSAAATIYKLSIINGQKDSVNISRAQFATLAKPFTDIHLIEKTGKKLFIENSFLDLATGSFTFTYSCSDSTIPVKNISILVDTTTMQVKRIFINKNYTIGDSIIQEKYGWKNNNSFFINRSVSNAGKPVRTELTTVAWSNK